MRKGYALLAGEPPKLWQIRTGAACVASLPAHGTRAADFVSGGGLRNLQVNSRQ